MDIKGFIVYILLIIFKRPERMPIILFSIFNDDNFKLYQLLNEIFIQKKDPLTTPK